MWDSQSKCALFSTAHLERVMWRWIGCTTSMRLREPNCSWQHCGNKYVGVDQYCYARVLYLLTHHILPAARNQNIAQVWTEIQEIYAEEKAYTPPIAPCIMKQTFAIEMYLYQGRLAQGPFLGAPLEHIGGYVGLIHGNYHMPGLLLK